LEWEWGADGILRSGSQEFARPVTVTSANDFERTGTQERSGSLERQRPHTQQPHSHSPDRSSPERSPTDRSPERPETPTTTVGMVSGSAVFATPTSFSETRWDAREERKEERSFERAASKVAPWAKSGQDKTLIEGLPWLAAAPEAHRGRYESRGRSSGGDIVRQFSQGLDGRQDESAAPHPSFLAGLVGGRYDASRRRPLAGLAGIARPSFSSSGIPLSSSNRRAPGGREGARSKSPPAGPSTARRKSLPGSAPPMGKGPVVVPKLETDRGENVDIWDTGEPSPGGFVNKGFVSPPRTPKSLWRQRDSVSHKDLGAMQYAGRDSPTADPRRQRAETPVGGVQLHPGKNRKVPHGGKKGSKGPPGDL